MVLKKKLVVIALSFSVLSACTQQENSAAKDNSSPTQNHEEKEVKKHQTERLPVTIYSDSDYKIEGQQVGFQRIITKIEMKDFDESSEIDFYDRYDQAVRNQGFDLQKDYKLLKIDMEQKTEEEARSRPLEAFMLNEGSGLVIGEDELASQNELLRYQQDFLATDFKVGKKLEETGNIIMAVPKEYADDPNLQLRIKQQIDDEKKYVYVDMN